MQFVLPPLTPDGVKFFNELAGYLVKLGQAVGTGRVFILDEDVAARMSASFNWTHGELRAGWAQQGIGGSLLILAKLLAKQISVAEATALTLGMPADSGLEPVPALRGSIAANLFELTDADRDVLLTVRKRLELALLALSPSLEDYVDHGDDPSKLWSVEDVGRHIAQAAADLRAAQLAIDAARETLEIEQLRAPKVAWPNLVDDAPTAQPCVTGFTGDASKPCIVCRWPLSAHRPESVR